MADNPYPNPGGGGGASADGAYAERGRGVENGYLSDEDDFREREEAQEEDTSDEDAVFGGYREEQRDYYAILNVPRDVCMHTSTCKRGIVSGVSGISTASTSKLGACLVPLLTNRLRVVQPGIRYPAPTVVQASISALPPG